MSLGYFITLYTAKHPDSLKAASSASKSIYNETKYLSSQQVYVVMWLCGFIATLTGFFQKFSNYFLYLDIGRPVDFSTCRKAVILDDLNTGSLICL